MASLSPCPAAPADAPSAYPVPRRTAWLAFAMTFALMLSDYLSRQVINAVFPFLKADWALSDTQLGSLVSAVALTIGLTSIPISLFADRHGRVRSATAMALVWALSTIACGLTHNFMGLLLARAMVGLGEAGYGSAGAAILTRAFPARLHATVMGAFLSAGMIGSVLGVVLGGVIAQSLGWQMAFLIMGGFGLVIALAFPLVVKEPPAAEDGAARLPVRLVLVRLLTTPTLVLVALAGGMAMFVQSAFIAWLPSYLNRYFGLAPTRASLGTGVLILLIGLGMIVGGALVDRCSVRNRANRLRIMAAYCLCVGVVLMVAMRCPPGALQFCLLGLGLLASSSFLGPALAVAADVTPAASHATTFSMLALAYMLVGAAPGPFVTGLLADRLGLAQALTLVPGAALLGAAGFLLAARSYLRDRIDRATP